MKKVYFICEDKKILDKLKAEFGGERNVEFWIDPTFVGSLNDTDFIVSVINSQQKLTAATMSNRDYHSMYSLKLTKFREIVWDVHKQLYGFEKLDETLKKIEEGSLRVRFAEYLFGGNHVDDIHRFELLGSAGEVIGEIDLLDLDGFWLSLGGEKVHCNDRAEFSCRVDRAERARVKDVLNKALIRDDKEYAGLYVDEQGKVVVPFCYGDISREEILQENFKEETSGIFRPL